jgi:hypothetical protein
LMPFIILEWFHVARYIRLCLSNNWAVQNSHSSEVEWRRIIECDVFDPIPIIVEES